MKTHQTKRTSSLMLRQLNPRGGTSHDIMKLVTAAVATGSEGITVYQAKRQRSLPVGQVMPFVFVFCGSKGCVFEPGSSVSCAITPCPSISCTFFSVPSATSLYISCVCQE